MLLYVVLLTVCGPAYAGVAKLAPAQEAQLAAGEVLMIDRVSAKPGGISVEGLADTPASTDAIWRALLDFKARLASNSAVKEFAYYKPSTATEQWGVWDVTRFGIRLTYHNHYILDRAAGTLVHELDPAQTNDLTWSRGTYTLGPSPNNADWRRISYVVDTEFGVAIPSFIKSWLCGTGVRDYMADLVIRAGRS
ncbi:MAG: hypothetical protein EXR69_05885 [Myxococcales bacterium]|nr:hypothetical protein [Myxococcales bacterium]